MSAYAEIRRLVSAAAKCDTPIDELIANPAAGSASHAVGGSSFLDRAVVDARRATLEERSEKLPAKHE